MNSISRAAIAAILLAVVAHGVGSASAEASICPFSLRHPEAGYVEIDGDGYMNNGAWFADYTDGIGWYTYNCTEEEWVDPLM